LGVDWIIVAEDGDRWLALVNAVMNLLQRCSYRADYNSFYETSNLHIQIHIQNINHCYTFRRWLPSSVSHTNINLMGYGTICGAKLPVET